MNRVATIGAGAATVLATEGLSVGYGDVPVVRDLDLEVQAGEVVALLGRNGAGKTTTLLALAGLLRPSHGHVLHGGVPTTAPAYRRARAGTAFVGEDRGIFRGLTVAENLRLGAGPAAAAVALFPELEAHLARRAGLLSGGQQQMLAVGRALAARPDVLLVDELSQGLAPLVVDRLLEALRDAAASGVSVVLVEQHARTALENSHRAYVLDGGRIVSEGNSAGLLTRLGELEATYLGGAR